MIKKILLAVALALPMLASAQTFKLGVVDTNAIVAAMPETAAAQTKLDDIQKKYEAEYTQLNTEMKRLFDEVNNMKEDEPAAIRDRKTREFSDYQQKVQQFEQAAMQDLQKQQQDLMNPIIQKIQGAVESVGKEGGYSAIQEKAAFLFFAEPAVDITPMVKAKLGIK